jgi:hypothetical protein
VPANVLRLLERLHDVPAMVINACYDVLAWNQMLVALIGDLSAVPDRRRNRLRRLFDDSYPVTGNKLQLARQCVADLRASGRYPDDPDVRRLVDELSADSPLFAELWATREIEVQRLSPSGPSTRSSGSWSSTAKSSPSPDTINACFSTLPRPGRSPTMLSAACARPPGRSTPSGRPRPELALTGRLEPAAGGAPAQHVRRVRVTRPAPAVSRHVPKTWNSQREYPYPVARWVLSIRT